MNRESQQRILIAPLDWGLGHTTRCIPLIRGWIKNGAEVVIAASGNGAAILRVAFPECRIIALPGYAIRYSSRLPLLFSLLLQLPKFLRAIRHEKKWLQHLLDKEKFDLVVSDNRYGLYNHRVKSILITHQLFIQVPSPLFFLKNFIQKKTLCYISAFDECWIPDIDSNDNLSGDLSKEGKLPTNTKFIGWLSRFDNSPIDINQFPVYDHLILLSGPEPMRSKAEGELLQEAIKSGENTLLVQGLPSTSTDKMIDNVRVVAHLHDDALKHALLTAKKITCRSGYSTLMDLKVLGRTGESIRLIPTPGQTEQEYLAKRWQSLERRNTASLTS